MKKEPNNSIRKNKQTNMKQTSTRPTNAKQVNERPINSKQINTKKSNIKQTKKMEKKQQKQEKKQRKKKSKGWKIFRLILLILLVAILVFAGMFTYRVVRNGGGLQGFIAAAVGHDENTLKDLDKINFLIVGISGCEEDYKLADTIMVCSYDPKAQKASLLSIPRDTYVGTNKAKATASYKINAVYRNGQNIDGMVKSIEEITGIEINNYVIIDTEALAELVDAIGGVEFDVPIDMKYDDVTQDLHIDLKAGYQKLNGKQAEWLVRFRHNNNGTSYSYEYGDNDIGRMRTQREFIQATLKQTMKPENLLKITQIAQIAYNNVQTNMNFDTIKDYLPYAVSFNTENLQTGTLPGTPELCNGVWIYTVNKKETTKIVDELFGDEEIEENEGNTVNTNTVNNTNITTNTTTKKSTNTTTKKSTNTTSTKKSTNTTKTTNTKK